MNRFSTLLLVAAIMILPAASLAQTTERTIDVRRGTRLDLANVEGSIQVRAWDRGAVHVVARHDPGTRVVIDEAGSTLKLRSDVTKKGATEWTLSVPRWMDLTLSNVNGSISIEGAGGRVQATNVKGGVTLRGGAEIVEVRSVEGAVVVRGTRGRITANAVNASVSLQDCEGPIDASAVNGAVRLAGIDSRKVEATSVNGEIVYDGTLHRDGIYRFSSHNGRLNIAVPAGTNADLKVSTFNGSFSATFPVAFDEARRGKSFSFVLGSGGAQIELQSFNGPIRLRRPGEP